LGIFFSREAAGLRRRSCGQSPYTGHSSCQLHSRQNTHAVCQNHRSFWSLCKKVL